MQKTFDFSLDCGGNVSLFTDGVYIYVESKVPIVNKDTVSRLNVCNKNGEKLCLGTFSRLEDSLWLSKSYPISYFDANKFSADDISYFYITGIEEDKAEETDNVSDDSDVYETDESLKRAEKVLKDMSNGGDYSHEAGICRNEISKFFASKSQIEFLPFAKFNWFEMTDIRHCFGLSALEHIMFNEFFVRAYVASGVWFFGKGIREGFYALCIPNEENAPNPMINAIDCTVCKEGTDGRIYYAVGIGIFDDGQYFYKITD